MTLAIGMNLAGNLYYGTEDAFINRMKTASQCLANNATAPVPVDANGYPTGIPAGADNVYVMVAMEPAAPDAGVRYVVRFSGAAQFLFLGGKIVSAEPGHVEFDWLSGDRQMPMQIAGLDPKAPLGDVSIVRADLVERYDAGEVFNPVFLSKVSPFDTLRYMDWGVANIDDDVEWSERTPLTAMTWQSAADATVPVEIMVRLANETKTNMWVCVPMRASDDYVRQLVAYIHANLDPALSLHLEYTNEPFNWATGVASYCRDQGNKLYGDQDAGNWMRWYGYRAAQIASAAGMIFVGADAARLRVVMAVQTAWEGLEDLIVQGIAKANLGTVDTLFDDYAVTTYFGNLSGDNDADKATVLGWARGGAAGLEAAFQAMRDGTGLTSFGSLKGLQPFYAYHAGVAAKLGLNLVAYEGGPGMTATSYAPADQAEIVAFFGRMEADPRMGEIVTQMATDFAAAGGKLLNVFNDAGLDSAWGTWGILKTIDGTSPAYDALVALTAKRAAAPVTTPPVTTPVPVADPAPAPVADPTPVTEPAPAPAPDPVPTKQPDPVIKPNPQPIVDPVDAPVEPVRPTKGQVDAALAVLDAATAGFTAAAANARALLAAFAA